MGKRKVEVNIISAEGLKISSKFGKARTYAVVWAHPSKKFYTHVDDEGGKSPVWNDKLTMAVDVFEIEQASGKLSVEIFHRGSIHDRSIGTVEIPLREIPHHARLHHDASELFYLAFEIHRPSKKSKGILNLSIRLREMRRHCSSSSSSNSSDSDASSPKNHPRPYSTPYSSPASVHPPAPSFAPTPSYGHGGYAPNPSGYGSSYPGYYPPQQQQSPGYGGYNQPYYGNPPPPPAKKGHSNLALGAGIAAGAIGGLVLGEVVENIAENAAEESNADNW